MQITINDRLYQAQAGETVLQVALRNGIRIPHLCYDERLAPTGQCRLCLVEIEGVRGYPPSCCTVVAEGMVVRTHTSEIESIRRTIIQLLLSDHPNHCLRCESNGECALQDLAYEYGLDFPNRHWTPKFAPDPTDNPFIIRDYNKCILCERCVRICAEVQGANALSLAGRGFEARVATFGDGTLMDSPCVLCGHCVDTCPTGALIDKKRLGQGRAKDFTRVKTTCAHCGVGCGMYLLVRDGQIVAVEADDDSPVNAGSLCVKGRYAYDFVHHPDRLTTPLVRGNGKLQEATWEEALNYVASRMKEILTESGPEAFCGWCSSCCTNEANYLFMKFMRAVIGTNTVDNCARNCHAPTVAGLATTLGAGAMTNSIAELQDATCIFAIGTNMTETHPVLSLRVRKAVQQGAKLIVADPRRIELVELATTYLPLRVGTDIALLNGMMHVIIREGLYHQQFATERVEGFEELRAAVAAYTPEYVAEITGVPAEDIVQAARDYATAERAAICYTMGITQHACGTDNVQSVANLALLCGNVGRRNTGVNPLRGQSNVQGACDMGGLPNVLTGYQKVDDPEVQAKFSEAWCCNLPSAIGLKHTEAIMKMGEGQIRCLYLMGEQPLLTDVDANHARKCLEKLDLLVMQDNFPGETMELAHVVLPATSWGETDGTFTNTERRVQRVRAAVPPPGEAKQDTWIICELARRMGKDIGSGDPEETWDEIARLTPTMAGISYARLEAGGLQWPCRTADDPGTEFLHVDLWTERKARFVPAHHIPPAEQPDEEYPLILTTGRRLYHYHTGQRTHHSQGLDEVAPEELVEINPLDGEELGLEDGDMVRIISRRGEVVSRAALTDRSPHGTIFMSFHYRETPTNVLTNPALDPKAGIPEFKACAVRVERIEEPAAVD
ncbi:MAG: formate dehydrogenase subunit alpha [Candidatus Zipacnadales bacterium]